MARTVVEKHSLICQDCFIVRTSTEVSFGLKILISKILQTLVKVDSIWLISYFRSIIVFASVVSGGFFLHDNTSEFLKSTVQTTLDSMVPLTQASTKI